MSHASPDYRTYSYGGDVAQVADLYLPAADRPPVVCLLHGGFWRMPFGRDQLHPIACDLAARGYAVWNLGYRRVGASGGGFPGALLDVDLGIDCLATLAAQGINLDLGRLVVAGHSAGGQLALWSAARRRCRLAGVAGHVGPLAVAGLAPVCDLISAYESRIGQNAVGEFLGGSPADVPERFAMASPLSLLPLGIPQLVIHGTEDDAVPVAAARAYVTAALALGERITFVELPGVGHMEFLDPSSGAFGCFCHWLEQTTN